MGFFNKASAGVGGKYFESNSPSFEGTSATTQTGAIDTTISSSTFTPLPDPFGRGRTVFTLSGDIPPGTSFNQSTGAITVAQTLSGINTNNLQFNFTVTATELNPQFPTRPAKSVVRNFSLVITVPFLYRQIVTTSYMCGGYKNSTLWSNVNRFVHSTETAVNLGDNNINNFHYKSGTTGYTKVFIWNGGTTAFNMRTEVRSNSGADPGGGNNGTAFDPDRIYAWVNGEGVGQVKKWTHSSETLANQSNGWNDHAASFSGEFRGIWWGQSGQTARVIFATDAYANMGYSAGAHGQQKGLMAKTGFGYGGAQGMYDGGSQFRRCNIESESQSNTYTKPWNCGEENFTLGQTRGYMLGQHDPSGQNNRSFGYTYATDSGFQGGSSMEPKGQAGCSSGHFGWRD